mmetsp:Transcript_23264/g.69747  ORF Transcript_23264/g.69747 Transcript_23264/m.69747 type:complete len:295 (+) Transcript_23264:723-1607(+)
MLWWWATAARAAPAGSHFPEGILVDCDDLFVEENVDCRLVGLGEVNASPQRVGGDCPQRKVGLPLVNSQTGHSHHQHVRVLPSTGHCRVWPFCIAVEVADHPTPRGVARPTNVAGGAPQICSGWTPLVHIFLPLNARVEGDSPSSGVQGVPHAPIERVIRDVRLDVAVVARILLDKVNAPTCVRLGVDGLVVVRPFVASARLWADICVDSAQKTFRVDVVAQPLDPVRKLHWVRLRYSTGVAVSRNSDALLDDHRAIPRRSQPTAVQEIGLLAEGGVVIVAAKAIPVGEAHRRE